VRTELRVNKLLTRMPRAMTYTVGVVGCMLVSGIIAESPDVVAIAHAQTPAGQPSTNQAATPQADDADGLTAATLERRGSVVFRDTPLSEVILILSEQWKINIVAGANISGQISGSFRQEKLEKILDSLLTANGYTYRQIGSSLVIMSKESVAANRPNFAVEVIDIPNQNTEDFGELTDALKLRMSPEGSLLPIRASGKFAISDTPENIAAVKQLLEQITGAHTTRYISSPSEVSAQSPVGAGINARNPSEVPTVMELRTQYVKAKDLEQPLARILGDNTFAVVEQENVIVVFGDAVTQQRAKQLLHQLDRPRAQVRITGYIYDVDLSEIERLGVDWNAQFMSRSLDANGVPRNLAMSQSGLLVPGPPNDALGIATGTASAAAAGAGGAAGGAAGAAAANGGQFMFRTLHSNTDIQALVQALDQTAGSRLLADPHVTVVDRHTASLGIVTEIPIQQLTQTQQGGTIGTTTFREAGITLSVTPRIANDGTIEMEVTPEFSVLAGFQNGNPIIDTRRATTTVRVVHGQALVIGGLRSKSTVETVKGIPGLMHAKFIGRLFRTHSTEIRESELIVLIMPEIVGFCGGLEREMHALEVTQRQLSLLSTATDGPICPDCNDKHCPHHNPRPRIHHGMQDNGLIGGYDAIFISPMPPVMAYPGSTLSTGLVEPRATILDAPTFPTPQSYTDPWR
jgi:general secretion pathway protein D